MSDRCLYSFYETSDGQTIDWTDHAVGYPAPGLDYEDALKFTSHLTDFDGSFGDVYSGLENCADVNNECRNIKLSAKRWIANGGIYPFTVKGGSEGVVIEGTLYGHGTEVDVDAGNKSDQSTNWVKNWELALTMDDGSPVVVRCLMAEAPREREGTGPYVYAFPSPFSWYHGIVVFFFKLIWNVG